MMLPTLIPDDSHTDGHRRVIRIDLTPVAYPTSDYFQLSCPQRFLDAENRFLHRSVFLRHVDAEFPKHLVARLGDKRLRRLNDGACLPCLSRLRIRRLTRGEVHGNETHMPVLIRLHASRPDQRRRCFILIHTVRDKEGRGKAGRIDIHAPDVVPVRIHHQHRRAVSHIEFHVKRLIYALNHLHQLTGGKDTRVMRVDGMYIYTLKMNKNIIDSEQKANIMYIFADDNNLWPCRQATMPV